jgi:signal transduction histidine kinase
MNESRARRLRALAFGTGGVILAGSAATLALAIVNRGTIQSLDGADPIGIVLPIGFAVVGALVASHHPRNPVGWLFLFIGVANAFGGLADQYGRYGLITAPGSVPGPAWALLLSNGLNTLVYPVGGAALLLLLLPSGSLPSRRWRWVAVLGLALTAIYLLPTGALVPGPLSPTGASAPAVPNPIGLPALQDLNATGALAVVNMVLYIAGLALIVVAAAAPFVRMRRARGDERQQLKWIAYAVLLSAFLSSLIAIMTWAVPVLYVTWLSSVSIILGFGIAFPVASGIAIFKYRLYDIDVIISRTIVYGSLAVLITAVYVGIAVGIGELVGGGGKPNLGLSILATGVVALGFQPVRERLQRIANRLVYGRRATPYEVLSEFSANVAETYAADDVLPRMARVVQQGTAAESAAVWLRSGAELRQTATFPHDGSQHVSVQLADSFLPPLPGSTWSVDVRHQGELLGALSVAKRRGETLTPIEEKLVVDLAHQAGLVLKNVGLTAELLHRIDELRASRQRLVSAQDDARRRLERNLHDGAQQNLVALKVKLGLAQILAARDPAKARTTVTELKADADEALETLRDLARGVYPPLLADKGLVAALESQARRATLPVVVEATGITRHPQDVEAAVYFCVLEALQNVQKYATAAHVVIRLREADRQLQVDVEDDGVGFDLATATRGAGLTNMEDRLDAIGGVLSLQSSPGHGTRLSVSLPAPTVVAA